MADVLCPNPIRGLAIRLAKANGCGVPVANTVENSRVTTRAFVKATFGIELEEGSEIVQKRADGSLCVADKAPDQTKWLSAEIQVCGYPFPLMQIALSMNAFVEEGSGDIIGGALPSRAQQAEVEATETLQMDLWQFNKSSDACSGGTAKPYVRNIFPLFRNRQLGGNINVEEGAASELVINGIIEETAAYESSDPDDPDMTATNTATMAASGPWGYIMSDELPDITDCAYDPVGSG